MNDQQAIEVREHLIRELNSYGFGDIVSEVTTRLRESYEEIEFQRSPGYLLDFFLRESIDVLSNLSNKDFEGLIQRFNDFTTEGSLNTISVELLDQGEPIFFDLRNLPNYQDIITVFKQIRNEIQGETNDVDTN